MVTIKIIGEPIPNKIVEWVKTVEEHIKSLTEKYDALVVIDARDITSLVDPVKFGDKLFEFFAEENNRKIKV